LDRMDAAGGTNIEEALRMGLGQLDFAKPQPRYVIFLTDGLPTVGVTDEKGILSSVTKCNTTGVRLFNFGVGYDVNVPLLDKLSEQNGGRSDYVKPKEPVEAKVTSLYNKIRNPVMTGLSVEIQGVRIRDMYPRKLGDLFEDDQIVVAGRYDARDVGKLTHNDGPNWSRHHTQLIVKGKYQGKERAFEYPVTLIVPSRRGYEFIEKLWAMRRMGYLMDQVQLHGKTKEVEDEIIRLSKQYGIMTPYTSFLADESTPLARPAEVHAKAGASFSRLEIADTAPVMLQPTAPGVAGGQMVGNTSDYAYEAGRKEQVANVRQAGNQAVYRRGQIWVAANAANIDLKKDKDKIQVVERYSQAYFDLVRANNVEENQVLASQQPSEELLITLRGQAYLIR
jgi:Ca-activated chloride channel family protein